MSSREEITQKYLFMALEELAKHRGSIKKGRSIEQMWRKELLYYENIGKYREERTEIKKPILNLRKKGE